MKFRFTYDGYQNDMIELVKKSTIIHRIKKDRTIEFAPKWQNDFEDLLAEFRFQLFNVPIIHHLDSDFPYIEYIHKLAEKNIPFVTEKLDDELRVITDSFDTLRRIEVLEELKVFPYSLEIIHGKY